MAGSIALSLTQRFDNTSHDPLDGGLLYFYAAGTTTPQSAYQDVSLTIPWPNPIELDSGGNVPQLFFADGYIKFRLSNSDGVTQISADNVLVIGPSAGAGAAPSVDATTILTTGDIKYRYSTGALTGFVRANGRTIGSISSGATERANADTQTLFEFLWTADANLSVSTGRGVSANADWVANKTIALPDFRGRVAIAADDMGNTAAGRVTTALSAIDGVTLGASGGSQTKVIITANLPSLDHTHGLSNALPSNAINQIAAVATGGGVNAVRALVAQGNSTDTFDPGGTSTPMTIMPPGIIVTTYLKL